MTHEMLEQFTVEETLEQSFQFESFTDVKSANRWLLTQDHIEIVAVQVTRRSNLWAGRLIPKKVLIAYQTTKEAQDFHYGISEGLEYCYDGNHAEGDIELAWKAQYPQLPLVSVQEEFCKSFKNVSRKYYVLYQAPPAKDGCPEVVIRTKNLFRNENATGAMRRRRTQLIFLNLILALIATFAWNLGMQDYYNASAGLLNVLKGFMISFDVLLGVDWILESISRLKMRRQQN